MSASNLITQGGFLMLLGMGVVFVFLGALVTCVSLVSRLCGGDAAAAGTDGGADVAAPPQPVADLMSDPELVSVITGAIHKYRSQQDNDNNRSPSN